MFKIRKRPSSKHKKRLEKIVRVIECSDSIRKGHLHATTKLAKELISLESSKAEFKYLRRDFRKVEGVLKSSLHRRLNRILKITNVLQIVCLQYFVLVMILTAILRVQPEIAEQVGILFTFPVMLTMFILAVTYLVMDRYLKKRIKAFTEKRSEPKGRDRRLKELAQKFINMLNEEVAKFKEDPKKFRFRIYHTDYERIQIVKKPGAISDHYSAIVAVGGKKS